MKNNLQTTPLLVKMVVLFTSFMLVMLYNQSKAATIQKAPQYSSRQQLFSKK
jgi:hypothetical protein